MKDIVKFINYLEAFSLSGKTLRNYKSDINDFLRWFDIYLFNKKSQRLNSLDQIAPLINSDTVRHYITYISNKPKKTINRRLSTLRHLANYFLNSKLIHENFMENIGNIEKPGSFPKGFAWQSVLAIITFSVITIALITSQTNESHQQLLNQDNYYNVPKSIPNASLSDTNITKNGILINLLKEELGGQEIELLVPSRDSSLAVEVELPENDFGLAPDESEVKMVDLFYGSAFIKSDKFEVTIKNQGITRDSLIFVSPTSPLSGASLYVKNQTEGQFTVALDKRLDRLVTFNWFIK